MDAQQLRKRLSRLLRGGLKGRPAASPEPTVYLHIGMPKTATTAIQRFLFENRADLLAKQGCLYPCHAMGWYQQVPLVKSIVRSVFPQAIFNESIADIDLAEWLAGLREQYIATDCSKIIISSEYLWASPAMQTHMKFHGDTDENFSYIEGVIKKTLETFSEFNDVKIVVYLRRQDSWLESFFNQQIKIGAVIPAEDAVMAVKNYLLYARNLKLWADYFGSENIIVRLYETTAPDIISDFCQATGLDFEQLIRPDADGSETTNPSLSPRAVNVMRMAIDKELDPEQLERMRIVLTNTSAVSNTGDNRSRYAVFSKQFHDHVLDMYEKDTKELVTMYPESKRYLEKRETTDEQPQRLRNRDYRWEEQVELLLQDLVAGKGENQQRIDG